VGIVFHTTHLVSAWLHFQINLLSQAFPRSSEYISHGNEKILATPNYYSTMIKSKHGQSQKWKNSSTRSNGSTRNLVLCNQHLNFQTHLFIPSLAPNSTNTVLALIRLIPKIQISEWILKRTKPSYWICPWPVTHITSIDRFKKLKNISTSSSPLPSHFLFLNLPTVPSSNCIACISLI